VNVDSVVESLSPADGWYFVHENTSDNSFVYPATFHKIIQWAKYSNGDVIGMVAAHGVESECGTITNRLVMVPPVKGTYLHVDEMTDEDIQ